MTDNDLFALPDREWPAEVRDRLYAKLQQDLTSAPAYRPHRLRAPLAVAASVAVFAIGAVLVSQATGPHGAASPAGPVSGTNSAAPAPAPDPDPSLDAGRANADLDRCWAALGAHGKAGGVPDRARWQPIFQVTLADGRQTVTAAWAAGKPLFCATTATTVTVSDPNATPGDLPGSGTGLTLATTGGLFAGVLDGHWSDLAARVTGDGVNKTATAVHRNGLFVLSAGMFSPSRQVTVTTPIGYAEAPMPLPASASPLLFVTDRPIDPTVNSALTNELIDNCWTHSVPTEPAGQWLPGPLVTIDGLQTYLARNGTGMGMCFDNVDGRIMGYAYVGQLPARASSTARPILMHPSAVSFAAGVLPGSASRLELVLANGSIVPAGLRNGMFVAVLGERMTTVVSVRMYDANGQLSYSGPPDRA